MRKQFLYITLALVLIMIAGCNGKKIDSQWTNKPFLLDGKFDDWEGMETIILEDQDLVMATSNDENNLYLMFRGNDRQLEQRIRRMGVTIWLNEEGKKNKGFGIVYTGSTDIHISYRPDMATDNTENNRFEEMRPRFENKRREDLPNPGMITIIRGENKTEINESNPDGPAAGSAIEKETFCYEFRLPLNNYEVGKNISLGLELGGLSDEELSEMKERMGGMVGGGRSGGGMGGRSGGMGGRPGGMGGRSGGMSGGRPSAGTDLEPKEIWFKVLLAPNNQ